MKQTEELNTQLYKAMWAEQNMFRRQLMKMEPHEILEHAYEYVTREDILLSLEYNDLPPKQAKALLDSPTPLADIFAKYESWETNYMDMIWSAVEARANDLVRADFMAARKQER